jgi:hypothetical protein
MKRRDVLKAIELRALMRSKNITLREGGRHTVVTVGNSRTYIPRHREIGDGTIEAIMKDLEPEFGRRWLKR